MESGSSSSMEETAVAEDCKEALQNPEMGGVAFSLPHESLLLEVAKHELHATTALLQPNQNSPTRIGLVYYQHANLHVGDHGTRAFKQKEKDSQHAKYITWLKGEFVPYLGEIKTLSKVGYVFPTGVLLKARKAMKTTPETSFKREDFPDFVPGKIVDGTFIPIDVDE